MSMLIIPRPLRDMVAGPYQLDRLKKTSERSGPESGFNAVIGILGGGSFTEPTARKIVCAPLRIGLAAAGVFALMKFGAAPLVAGCLGGVFSVPSLAVAGGGYLAYYGGVSAISALASGSLAELAIGFAAIASGWITLEYHDILPLGIAEFVLVQPIAQKFWPYIVKSIM